MKYIAFFIILYLATGFGIGQMFLNSAIDAKCTDKKYVMKKYFFIMLFWFPTCFCYGAYEVINKIFK